MLFTPLPSVVPRHNSIRVQNSKIKLKSALMFCVNYQGKSSNDQVPPLVLPWMLQIKNSTPAGNRVSEKVAGNIDRMVKVMQFWPGWTFEEGQAGHLIFLPKTRSGLKPHCVIVCSMSGRSCYTLHWSILQSFPSSSNLMIFCSVVIRQYPFAKRG